MKNFLLPVVLIPGFLAATPTTQELEQELGAPILDPGQPLEETRVFIEKRVPTVPDIKDPEEWQAYSAKLRHDILDKVVFRGTLAPFWQKQPSKIVYSETLSPSPDYTIQKLRFEIIPGWWCPALLYVPAKLPDGKKVPVVINVNGHDSMGKAAPYKQIRCIHQARNGMIAMNVEWIGMGQFNDRMSHYHLAQLDLCGVSGIAPFYLNVTRAIDAALQHPNADQDKVAVAGLSGGGWQTIFTSALDTRVKLANPVAGYSSFKTRARYPSDLGDSEQTPNDLATVADYTHLTALLSGRALLLTKNATDQCCFAAPHALPPLEEAARPKFKLMGRDKYFRTHINKDPGTHNFEEDNRRQLYKMLGYTFYGRDNAISQKETHTAMEIQSMAKLEVPLPEDNLNLNYIANIIADGLPVPHPSTDPFTEKMEPKYAIPALHEVLHTRAYKAEATKVETKKIGKGYNLTAWKLVLGSEWTIPVVELTPPGKPKATVLLLGDNGRASLASISSQQLAAGNRVLALDLFNFGETNLGKQDFLYSILVSALGERPLGVQTSQLAAISGWAMEEFGGQPVNFETLGPRTSTIALITSVLSTNRIGKGTLHNPLESLKSLIKAKFGANQSTELFCFGLLKHFDIPLLLELANAEDETRVTIAK
jgi:hypothetical protein